MAVGARTFIVLLAPTASVSLVDTANGVSSLLIRPFLHVRQRFFEIRPRGGLPSDKPNAQHVNETV